MKIQARGKRRVRVDEGLCSCGRPLPHMIQPVEGRTMEEKQERLERAMLAFGPPPPRASPPRMKPSKVLELRGLGCKLPDYPAEGTPEWEAFVADAAVAQAARNAKLSALPKKTVPKFDPNSPERRMIAEQMAVENERAERTLTLSEDADAARDDP